MVDMVIETRQNTQNIVQGCSEACRIPSPCCGKCPYLQQDITAPVEEPISFYHIGLLGSNSSDPILARKIIREIMYMPTFNQPPMEEHVGLDSRFVRIHSYEMELIVANSIDAIAKIKNYMHGFILFYGIDDPNGFEMVSLKWVPKLKILFPNVPIFLCATGIEQRLITYDIVNFSGVIRRNCCQKHVASRKAEKFAHANGLVYEEISVKTKEGVEDLFNNILIECIVHEAEAQKLTKNPKTSRRLNEKKR
uniref:Uncharacterized protein n=1 Tax=Acrobeloides nanus TaxID=290746 RepID=A0A914CT95_9BILA